MKSIPVVAYFDKCVKADFNVQSRTDRRRKVDCFVYSYRYLQYEWRVAMECKRGEYPTPSETIHRVL
jgi:hypothetical protein